MHRDNNNEFNSICELFCHLTKLMEDIGNHDFAEIINHLMSVWLDRTLTK